MSLSSAAVAQAAALPSLGLLPPPPLAHRSDDNVAAGCRDLVWPQERIASALLQRSGGRPVHLLLHGGARGADRSIRRAAQQLGWRVQALAADWRRYGRSAGPIRNRLLLEQALVEAQAHISPAFSTSVLVIAFPGGAGTASLVQQAVSCSSRPPGRGLVRDGPPPFPPDPHAAGAALAAAFLSSLFSSHVQA
ncbi:MAG: SLOG family protein, partial [Cyanobacteriota bacterium]